MLYRGNGHTAQVQTYVHTLTFTHSQAGELKNLGYFLAGRSSTVVTVIPAFVFLFRHGIGNTVHRSPESLASPGGQAMLPVRLESP